MKNGTIMNMHQRVQLRLDLTAPYVKSFSFEEESWHPWLRLLTRIAATFTTSLNTHGKDEDKDLWSTSVKLNKIIYIGACEIRTKLDPFVHIHNGTILHKSLPGFQS